MLKSTFLLLFTLFLSSCILSEENKLAASKLENRFPAQTNLEKSMERGKLIYDDFCLRCHLPNGEGQLNTIPPLAGSNWLTDKRREIIHAVKFGQQGEIVVNGLTYNDIMAPMGLTYEEVADVLNFVMNSWGNSQDKMVTVEEVEAVEK
jgi:mono/diheme cytochrome c family protein